jgi:hypothetical protein
VNQNRDTVADSLLQLFLLIMVLEEKKSLFIAEDEEQIKRK